MTVYTFSRSRWERECQSLSRFRLLHFRSSPTEGIANTSRASYTAPETTLRIPRNPWKSQHFVQTYKIKSFPNCRISIFRRPFRPFVGLLFNLDKKSRAARPLNALKSTSTPMTTTGAIKSTQKLLPPHIKPRRAELQIPLHTYKGATAEPGKQTR